MILFQYDDAGRLIGEYDELGNAIRQYVWLDDLPVAMVNGDSVFYLHADHLNTRRVATDAHGDVVWQPVLRPFGDQPITAFGELEMPLRFPGQYFDRETGLHQNWHREYAPGLGRYTQSDPIGTAGGFNVYLFVFSNPLIHVDFSGLKPSDCAGPCVARCVIQCWETFEEDEEYRLDRFLKETEKCRWKASARGVATCAWGEGTFDWGLKRFNRSRRDKCIDECPTKCSPQPCL